MNTDRLFDAIAHDLGWHDHNMRRERPYNGQPHTVTGQRGATEIKGITFRDLRDCYLRALVQSHPYYDGNTINRLEPNATFIDEANKGEAATLCEDDIYKLKGDIDPIAVVQNIGCEIEKLMGIFPNVPKIKEQSHD